MNSKIIRVNRLNSHIGNLGRWLAGKQNHFFFWCGFISFECMVAKGYHITLAPYPALFTSYLLNILFFYLFVHLVLSKSLNSPVKNVPQMFAGILVWFILGIFLKILLDCCMGFGAPVSTVAIEPLYKLFAGHLYRWAEFAALAAAYFYFLQYVSEREEKFLILQAEFSAHLRKQKSVKQIEQNLFGRYIKQFDTHLVFSTLNHLQASIQLNEQLPPDGLINLAKLIQYNISTEMLAQEVLLSDELKQIALAVQIRSLTAAKPIAFQIKQDQQEPGLLVCPMFLLPLANVILNHAFVNGINATLQIVVSSGVSGFSLRFNQIELRQSTAHFESALIPARQQLNDYYAERASILLIPFQQCYSVEIIIEKEK